MTIWKRGLAALLSALMLLSLLPVSAFAESVEEVEQAVEATAEDMAESAEAMDRGINLIAPTADAEIAYSEEETASLDSVADTVYEIGYRFDQASSWTIVGTDERYSNGRDSYQTFDENRNYAIELPQNVSFESPLPVYFIIWDAYGHSDTMEGQTFSFEDEESEIRIDRGEGYTFSVYAPWLEEMWYTVNGRTVRLTSDEDWFHANSEEYLYAAKGNTIEISLDRYTSFPCNVSFSIPGSGEAVAFSDLSDGAQVTGSNSVEFQKQDASVKAGNYTFQVHDPLYGEVRYTLNGHSMTFGRDAEWAESHQNSYTLMENGEYIIQLGDNDYFPLRVGFYLRGDSGQETFSVLSDGVIVNENAPTTAVFQKQDAFVTVGDYTFKAHDERAGEVQYTLHGSKTLGKDADWAKIHSDGYVYMENNAYTIVLEETDTFPVEVSFSLPRDPISALAFTEFNHASVKAGSDNTIVFSEQDASVKAGEYTFTVHSPWVGAVRYRIVSTGRTQDVGPDAEYAAEKQEKAAKQTQETRKQYPRANAVPAEYVSFADGRHTIELNNEEYFPCTVAFSTWNPETGWGAEESKIFDGVQSVHTVFDHAFSIHADWLEEVRYRLPGQSTITVGHDADKASVRTEYELFDTTVNSAGNYAINPNDSILFPCDVTFTVRNASGSETETTEIFTSSGTPVEIRGHVFTIRSSIWRGEVVYRVNSSGQSGIVSRDGAWAKNHDGYDVVGADGTYAIKVGAGVSFPLKVSFRLRESEKWTEKEFKNLNAVHTINGITFSIHPTWLDEVQYTLVKTVRQEDGSTRTETQAITVGDDEERAKQAEEAATAATEVARRENPQAEAVRPDYVFASDGRHAIIVEDDAFFPYGISFQYTRLKKEGNTLTPEAITRTVWFESPEDRQDIGAYTFSIASRRTDPAKLIRAGLWMGIAEEVSSGGQYVPFVKYADRVYWADKTSEAEYEASLQSLLPLREERLYTNLDGFFPWELENARLEIVLPAVEEITSDAAQSVNAAKNQAAWGNARSGSYEIIDNGGAISISGGTYEMITGQLDQLNQSDMRYVVQIHTDPPEFIDGQLNMKASYANTERGGIRIKGEGYQARGGKYTVAESKGGNAGAKDAKQETVGAYKFTVNEEWADGSVYLTMRLNDQAENYQDYKDLTAMVYEGVYLTVDAFRNAVKTKAEQVRSGNITEKVWGQELDTQTAEKRYSTRLVADKEEGTPYFTLVWYRNGNAVAAMPFQVLVSKDPDAQWELPEAVQPDVIVLNPPHTHNTTVKNEAGEYENWELIFDKTETDETSGVDFRYYRMPSPTEIGSVAVDRFYISAKYRHFTKKDALDGLGNKAEADIYEPSDMNSYYGTYQSAYQTQSERAQNSGTAFWQEYGIRVYAGMTRWRRLRRPVTRQR